MRKLDYVVYKNHNWFIALMLLIKFGIVRLLGSKEELNVDVNSKITIICTKKKRELFDLTTWDEFYVGVGLFSNWYYVSFENGRSL